MTDPVASMVDAFGWETGVTMPRDVDPDIAHRTISRLLEKGMAFSVLATADGIQIFTHADAYFERCLPDRGRDGRFIPLPPDLGRLSLRPLAQPGPVRRSCRMDGRGRFTHPSREG
ncbi:MULTISPECIES: hypothetical protein [unclassified Inquilinus]|uniref:hypothetical protein n=1 Tax=unclassified Inquilinus TaxID=2645927 RepID=UPI003F8FB36B